MVYFNISSHHIVIGSEGASQAYYNLYDVASGSAQCTNAAFYGRGYWTATCANSNDYVSYSYYGEPILATNYVTTATQTNCAVSSPTAPAAGFNLPYGNYAKRTRYSGSTCTGQVAGFEFYQENVCYSTLTESLKVKKESTVM